MSFGEIMAYQDEALAEGFLAGDPRTYSTYNAMSKP
jgi:hypothetical protein